MRLSDIPIDNIGQHVLLYGPPKSGKTLLAGAIAEYFENVYWFDLEHGFITLKQLPKEAQAHINLIQIPDTRINHLAIKAMLKLTEGKPIEICDIHGRVGATCIDCRKETTKGNIVRVDVESLGPEDVVVMDSLTQLSHSAMGKAFEGEEIIKPEYKHYTAQGVYLDRFLNSVQRSKANWVVITHEESIEQQEGKEKIIPMAGTRNFSRNTAKYFDHVVYLSIKNRQYSQNSDGLQDPKILTGSRTGVKLDPDVTQGLVDLIRSVKDSPEEIKAKNKLVASKVEVNTKPKEEPKEVSEDTKSEKVTTTNSKESDPNAGKSALARLKARQAEKQQGG